MAVSATSSYRAPTTAAATSAKSGSANCCASSGGKQAACCVGKNPADCYKACTTGSGSTARSTYSAQTAATPRQTSNTYGRVPVNINRATVSWVR
ncbi:MAG: hypothetical protein LBN39_00865 [Planctomycetaceae bacterium]|nr:hypothetical protein [Planctomycetaceae bacterium]